MRHPAATRFPLWVGVALVLLAFALSGCDGCTYRRARERVYGGYARLSHLNRKGCHADSDCIGAGAECPPATRPWCIIVGGAIQGNDYPMCGCTNQYWVYPDGGPAVLFECVGNRDGGPPICGEVEADASGFIIGIKGEDGGLIVDMHGGGL